MGSGKGSHTTGRGQKGQKSRGKVNIRFEGTKVKKSLIKRLPMLRGKGKFKAWGQKFQVINLGDLANWPTKMEVTPANLLAQGIIKDANMPVKILAEGEINQPLTVKVSVSGKAGEKITKAGGTIAA